MPKGVDTNILILRAGIDPNELPDEMMISAITTAELSAGVLAATSAQELAQRMKILQTAEAEFNRSPSTTPQLPNTANCGRPSSPRAVNHAREQPT
ncbi:hypothetical protein [Nonomuraea sp. NPDC049480]|uniref:hypothetical protein n=1 Tax=Nonomuraea sp. NPDC049480 TaxID=3364353 RepID=UPI0037A6C2AE